MPYTFFHIRAVDSRAEAERLNAFLSSHLVLQVERHFAADGENSFWSASRPPAGSRGTESLPAGRLFPGVRP